MYVNVSSEEKDYAMEKNNYEYMEIDEDVINEERQIDENKENINNIKPVGKMQVDENENCWVAGEKSNNEKFIEKLCKDVWNEIDKNMLRAKK